MKLLDYLKDKIIYIFLSILVYLIIFILLLVFDSNNMLIVFILSMLCINSLFILLLDYFKKRSFYLSFKNTLDALDKKYLITEMIQNSNFLDGKLLLEYLYDINKSMHEQINSFNYTSLELKEYIELWCHEIKTPIATSKLIIENNNNSITQNILEEIEHIENYVEQVLFYSRSDTVEKDYIISNIDLKKVVNNVIKKNKKTFIEKKIKIDIDELCYVKSDSKWLEFILNQIVTNSIKYSKNSNSSIKIYCKKNKNNHILYIEDNGIGIDNTEIDKVFNKGFTGINGRKKYNSTGIGLYLCKKLCTKLGHNIGIESELNKYTIVCIIFPNNSLIEDNV